MVGYSRFNILASGLHDPPFCDGCGAIIAFSSLTPPPLLVRSYYRISFLTVEIVALNSAFVRRDGRLAGAMMDGVCLTVRHYDQAFHFCGKL
jgi:hypothetical protein